MAGRMTWRRLPACADAGPAIGLCLAMLGLAARPVHATESSPRSAGAESEGAHALFAPWAHRGGGGGGAPTRVPERDPSDALFGLDRVHRIDLRVGDTGVRSLLAEPRAYVPGSVRIDGETLERVGVRLKGHAGSFVPLDGTYPPVSGDGNGRPGKSAFVLRFDAFDDEVRHRGLKKLTLNNLVQDPSSVHEMLGYALFREGGVPASRVGYAAVTFNGEPKGLYAIVESPDDPAFLRRWFESPDGNLYEGEYGVDLRREHVERFEQDRGRHRSRSDLRGLVAALDAAEGTDGLIEVLEERLDLDAYLAFAATELYLGHFDGYAWSANNYRIYREPSDGRWAFIPWGIDQVFRESLGPHSGVMRSPGPSWGEGGAPGRVHAMCMSSSACRVRLHDAFRDLLSRVDAMGLVQVTEDALELVGDVTIDEARAYGDPMLAIEAQEAVFAFVGRRSAEIERWLPCLVGSTVDGDRDGHDGCRTDCDDGNPAVHPGAAERCNFRDDDCNGVVDDPPTCPRCLPVRLPDRALYGLCIDPRPWGAARQQCRDERGELASLHDQGTAEFLAHAFAERLGVGASWIGLTDVEREGDFAWVDGTPLDLALWARGAPRPDGEDADCVSAGPSGWRDVPCGESLPALCRLPNHDTR